MAAKSKIRGGAKASKAKVSIRASTVRARMRSRTARKPRPDRPHIVRRPDADPAVLKFVVLEPEAVPAPMPPEFEDLGEIPESYGSNRVFLVARDPHWFYAYWDVSAERMSAARAAARDGHVFLQICEAGGTRIQQIVVPPGAPSWFIHVGRPGVELYAELGHFNGGGAFQVIGRSPLARAPRETPSDDLDARFVTIPATFTFRELSAMVVAERREGEGLAETLARLQQRGFAFPFDLGGRKPLSAQEREELFRLFVTEFPRRYWIGSMETAERLRMEERLAGARPGWPFAPSAGGSPVGRSPWSGTHS